jgi:hypothetical protein
MERDMEHLDENNPKHMAHMMKKMKDLMPPGTMPKELDVAIKRVLKPAKTRKKLRRTWATCSAISWAARKAARAAAVTRRTADCMIIDSLKHESLRRCIISTLHDLTP